MIFNRMHGGKQNICVCVEGASNKGFTHAADCMIGMVGSLGLCEFCTAKDRLVSNLQGFAVLLQCKL